MLTAREKTVRILRILIAVILSLYFFTASIFVIQIGGRFPYQFLGVGAGVFVLVFYIVNRKFERTDWLLTLVFLSFILAALSAEINQLPEAYRKLSRTSALMAVPLYLVSGYLGARMKESVRLMDLLKLILKFISLLQVLWILLQYVMYHVFDIDINHVIFAEILHQEGLVSFYRETFYPAGFTWHGGSIAPLLVLAFVLFKNPIIRLIVLGESFLVGSSTAIIGVLAALFLTILLGIIRREYTIAKVRDFFQKKNIWKMVLGVLVVAALIILFIRMNLWAIVKDRALYLFVRLKNTDFDGSTQVHVRYFTGYPEIFRQSTWTERILGYGNFSSGYPFQLYFGQYTWMETFVVECDFINIILSRGIVGFLVYYVFLGILAIKGLKKDSRYFVFTAAVMLQGAGYNVQWQYIFMTEILLYLSLQSGRNFFEELADPDGQENEKPLPVVLRRFSNL